MGVTMVMEVICRVICKVTTGKVICKGTTGKVVIIGKVVICNNKGCREECKVVDMVIDKVIIHRGILNLLVKFQGKSCDVMCQTFISTGQSVLIVPNPITHGNISSCSRGVLRSVFTESVPYLIKPFLIQRESK